jgi:hypothetical protein
MRKKYNIASHSDVIFPAGIAKAMLAAIFTGVIAYSMGYVNKRLSLNTLVKE